MTLDPGAFVAEGDVIPPNLAPFTLITSGSTRGPSLSFQTSSGVASQNRLQLLAILNTGVAEPPSNVLGAGLSWINVRTVSLSTAPVTLSLWRALGNPVAGPLTINYQNLQEDCAWSWVEAERVNIGGVAGSAAVIQVNSGVDESFSASGQLIRLISPFAAAANFVYGAFLHNKPNSDPISATPGAGFTELHDLFVPTGLGFGYTAGLSTEFSDSNTRDVDIVWSATGALIGIVIEIGTRNVILLSSSIDAVIKANLAIAIGADGFIALPLSIRTDMTGAIKGQSKATCLLDCVVDSKTKWTILPRPTGLRWEDI